MVFITINVYFLWWCQSESLSPFFFSDRVLHCMNIAYLNISVYDAVKCYYYHEYFILGIKEISYVQIKFLKY